MSRISFKHVMGERQLIISFLGVHFMLRVHCHLDPKFSLEMLGSKKYTFLSRKQRPWDQRVLGGLPAAVGCVFLHRFQPKGAGGGQLCVGAARQADKNAGVQLNLVSGKQPKIA